MSFSRGQPIAVLASDPDSADQHALIAALQQRFHITVASTLRETDHYLRQGLFNILLLELDQTDGDGLEYIRYVHRDPQLHTTIIACVTRHASIHDKAIAFQAGADDYIVKPINPQTFAGRVGLLTRLSRLSTWRNVPTEPDPPQR